MTIKKKKYIRIAREKCPEDCPFKEKNNLPIILIPPPYRYRTKILLISRDPTIDFVSIYNYAARYKPDEMRRILFSAAIPFSLILKITKFCKRKNIEIDTDDLFKIFKVTYWTHFHKCPTDEKNKFTKKCADKWLKEEIIKMQKQIKAIICLGKDVEKWIIENKSISIDRIYLPHPSGANNAEWYPKKTKDLKDLQQKIKRLIEICQRI